MLRNCKRRSSIQKARGHLLAVLGAAIAGNILFALTGGIPTVGAAASDSSQKHGAPLAVSGIHYTVEPSDPSRLSAVTFSVTSPDGAAPTKLSVLLGAPSPVRFACDSLEEGRVWSCSLAGQPISELSQIQVFAD